MVFCFWDFFATDWLSLPLVLHKQTQKCVPIVRSEAEKSELDMKVNVFFEIHYSSDSFFRRISFERRISMPTLLVSEQILYTFEEPPSLDEEMDSDSNTGYKVISSGCIETRKGVTQPFLVVQPMEISFETWSIEREAAKRPNDNEAWKRFVETHVGEQVQRFESLGWTRGKVDQTV